MRWLAALMGITRNVIGPIDSIDVSQLRRIEHLSTTEPRNLGTVPISGHGGLTDRELASAGASIAVRAEFSTLDELVRERERFEAFVERQADPQSGTLRGSYWELQSAEHDENDEVEGLAAELQRLGRVEGAAVVGWVIRNTALKVQRPIAALARPVASDVTDIGDALELAETLLNSPQRLDPTDGGLLLSTGPRRRSRWRARGQFGDLWVYGD